MTKSDALRATAALVAVCGAYYLAFLIYAGLGGDIEAPNEAGFLSVAALLWVLIGAAFDRLWVPAVPLVPYLGLKLPIELSGTAVHYGRDAITLEQLLVVSVVALAIGCVLRRAIERVL